MGTSQAIRSDRTVNVPIPRGSSFKTQFLVSCAFAGLFCLCANANKSAFPPFPASEDNKIELRNNAASLLADLLGQEKDVSKILIIKHHSAGTEKVIKAISKTADEGSGRLETLAKSDKTMNLHALQLPPGEVATRAAVSKTEEHELILTFGTTFELNLLLTQTEALSYASHLAKIAADNSQSPEQQQDFHALDVSLDNLYKEVVAQIRAMPRK
jgi:hypothetical protein